MKNKRKKIVLSGVVLISILLITAACEKTKNNEEIAATVNGEDISMEKFDANYNVKKNIMNKQYGNIDWNQEVQDGKTIEMMFMESVLEDLIEKKILLQEAEKAGIKISDDELTEVFEESKSEFGSEDEYTDFLKENNLTEEFFRNDIYEWSIISKFYEKFDASDISEEEMKKYYDDNQDTLGQISASHILVETEETAKEILVKINNGEDFGKLAEEYSIDPGSKGNGGSLGIFGKGIMVPEFEIAAFSLGKGEVSDIVKSQFGYHIIKLDKSVEEFYEENKPQIMEQYKNLRFEEMINKAKEKAEITNKMTFENIQSDHDSKSSENTQNSEEK